MICPNDSPNSIYSHVDQISVTNGFCKTCMPTSTFMQATPDYTQSMLFAKRALELVSLQSFENKFILGSPLSCLFFP